LKGSAKIPPLRQAAIPLGVSIESVAEKVTRTETGLQSDNEAKKVFFIFFLFSDYYFK
jgi:hypothetical protein